MLLIQNQKREMVFRVFVCCLMLSNIFFVTLSQISFFVQINKINQIYKIKMKSKFYTYVIALVAMFSCVLSANAEATTYTGVDPKLGVQYYIYCPASQKFLTLTDANADFPEYGVWPMVGVTSEPVTLWTIGETEEAYSLSTTLSGSTLYLNYGEYKLNTYAIEFSGHTWDIDIKKTDDGYYTICRYINNDGYLKIADNFGNDKDVSIYSKFIFVPAEAESESSEEHVHSYQYDFGNNGQHNVTCSGCEYKTTEACADNDNDYKCDKCGMNLCKHTNGTVYEAKNGVHVVKCSTCGTKLGEASCTMAWVSNNDGTHKHQCSVCKNVAETGDCQDGNSNDKCDNCGYDMSQISEGTTVTGVDPVSGKYYFIYCPAQKQYFVPSLIQNPTNAIKGFAGFVDSNSETAWYCNEVGEDKITLSFKKGDNTYYVSFAEITDGVTQGVNKNQFDLGQTGANYEFILTTYSGSLDISKAGGYYSIGGMEQVYPSHIINYSQLIFIEATAANLKVSAAAKWGSFVAPFSATMPENVEAYQISEIESGNITFTKVAGPGVKLAANTPVVLHNTGSTDVNVDVFGIPAGTPNENADDYLVGVYSEQKVTEGSWVIQMLDGVVGFYPVKNANGIQVPKYKCYLQYSLPENQSAKGLTFSFADDTTTAIKSTSTVADTQAVYSVSGAVRPSMQRGLNIVKMSDGSVRKIMVK